MAEVKTPVLETKHLGISFGGLHAVQDFNIQMNAGELVGLIGPNGAGKTTVFNLLTGVYVPTEGTVLLNGVPLNGKKTHQRSEVHQVTGLDTVLFHTFSPTFFPRMPAGRIISTTMRIRYTKVSDMEELI